MITAAVTLRCSRNPAVNVANISATVDRIAEEVPGVGLIVFGEMVTGFYNPKEMAAYHKEVSFPVSDSIFIDIANSALRNRVHVCFGMSERSGTAFFNSQILLDPFGQIKTVHRKRNLKPTEIQAGYNPGELPVTFTEINGLRTAIIICSDAASMQTVKLLMKSSLDLIILSLADDKDENRFMARCNARLYDSWIVTANRFGEEGNRFWSGHTVISDPGGKIRTYSVGKEAVLFQNIESGEEPSGFRKLQTRIAIPFIILRNLRALRSYF